MGGGIASLSKFFPQFFLHSCLIVYNCSVYDSKVMRIHHFRSKVLAARILAFFCCAIVTAAHGAPGLGITVGQPFTIAKSETHLTWGYWCFPVLQQCADGDLLLSFN